MPGLAERIIRIAEKEQDQRHIAENESLDLDRVSIDKYSRGYKRGQYLTFCTIFLTIALCAYCVSAGFASEARDIAIGVIVASGSIFIGGKIWNNKNKS